jgi:hypothetical protein
MRNFLLLPVLPGLVDQLHGFWNKTGDIFCKKKKRENGMCYSYFVLRTRSLERGHMYNTACTYCVALLIVWTRLMPQDFMVKPAEVCRR